MSSSPPVLDKFPKYNGDYVLYDNINLKLSPWFINIDAQTRMNRKKIVEEWHAVKHSQQVTLEILRLMLKLLGRTASDLYYYETSKTNPI